MKNILILPYSFSNFFSKNKRVSGVDECLLKQKLGLESLGYNVLVYLPFSDIKDPGFVTYGVDISAADTKEFYTKNKVDIIGKLSSIVKTFSPDVILANTALSKYIYRSILNLDIPVYHLSHAVPGFFADMETAGFLNDALNSGHSLGCVSKYHAKKLTKYYAHPRKVWDSGSFDISPDSITPPTFAVSTEILHSTNTVRHISAANKEKKTFYIHHLLENNPTYNSQVYTTWNYVGGTVDSYITDNIEKFKSSLVNKTSVGIDHSVIMSELKNSVACFVGLATYDSFTITSIEALQAGIPLLLAGDSNKDHPALNFVEPEFQKYVYVFKTRTEFLSKLDEYSKMTIDARKALAQSCLNINSFDNFSRSYESALKMAIMKYNSVPNNNLEGFFN